MLAITKWRPAYPILPFETVLPPVQNNRRHIQLPPPFPSSPMKLASTSSSSLAPVPLWFRTSIPTGNKSPARGRLPSPAESPDHTDPSPLLDLLFQFVVSHSYADFSRTLPSKTSHYIFRSPPPLSPGLPPDSPILLHLLLPNRPSYKRTLSPF